MAAAAARPVDVAAAPADRPPGRERPPAAAKRPAAKPSGPSRLPQPPARYRAPPPGFCLSCVLRGGAGIRAIVNGRIVGVGDTVRGATVRRIMPQAVEMQRGGELFVLGAQSPRPLPPPEANQDS
jgi:hypothetical protein